MDKDKFTRQYDYKANSNLVLPTDTSLIDKRPSNEETGEVQSLVGRLAGKMGDRVDTKRSTKLSKLDADEGGQQKKASKKRHKKNEPAKLKPELSDSRGFSVADIDTKDLLYQPKSEQTALVYGLIIKFVRKQLGFQHISIINGAADEVIDTMKDSNLDEESRRVEIERLLSSEQSISDEDYNELCNLCKKINDWDSSQAKIKEDTAEEEADGVGVVYVDSDDDASSDEYLSEIRDSDDEFDLDDMFEKAQADVDLMKPFAPMEIQEEQAADSQYTTLNLDDLSKRQSNITPKVEIGEPVRKEGYQEYTIIPKRRHSHKHDNLIKIEDLPAGMHNAFKGIKTLNFIQSEIYRRALRNSDKSLLICAPTGAGKTNIAVLAMLREILKYPREDESGFEKDKFKIIYVAPIKALVQEIVENFKQKLGGEPYNLNVRELTGDSQLNEKQISEAQIIVCTPEKWDIVTRKSLDRLYTKLVRLVIFDEIHLLHNERGATLEALVARIKRHKHLEGQPIRILGLSATLPNYRDVSRFIAPDVPEENSTFYFDSTYRPIPLHQQYIAMTETKKAFRMINDIVYEKVIERLVDHSQILIFVHSRPDTMKTGEHIKVKALEENKLRLFVTSDAAIERIREMEKEKILRPKLAELLKFGIGVHHAGLNKLERSCIEELFRNKLIRVLVSTATLAWGVNLPARTVIIKGTQVYRDGRWTDLDSLDVTQMLGRAGRPGFDKEGEGIVITQQSQVSFYMSLMSEQLPVESKLIGRLPEFVNSECVIGNVESLEDAVRWLSETYLNSRMLSVLQQPDNRQYLNMYGIDHDSKKNDPELIRHKHNLAYTAVCVLDDRGLIVFDRNSHAIKSTELGRIASHFNCSSRTIKLFFESIHEHTSDIELFRIFSLADEFKDIYVRRGEEVDLQTLFNQVPFPIDDKRATPGANKVNALLQVYIFRLNLEGSDLICDMHFIKENAARLARAIHEIVLMKGYALVAELSLDLCRKIDKQMTICHTPLRQFADALSADTLEKLETKRNFHIDELRVLNQDAIVALFQTNAEKDKEERYRKRKEAENVYKFLKILPKLRIEVSVKPVSKNNLRVDLAIQPDFNWDVKYHGYRERFWLLVEDVNQEKLLHYEMINVRKYRIRATFFVPYLKPDHPFYFLRVLSDNWFGCDHHLSIDMNELTLPDETEITTQPIDLEPQTVRSLENPMFERVYEEKFKGSNSNQILNFNQIQTQTFKDLYQSDCDVILLAPAGSGKTTCAELAVINNINSRGTESKSGFISANAKAAQIIYEDWTKLFGQHYGITLLTGNRRVDSKEVDKGSTNIVIGDPESWHSLTLNRSKKYRKLLSKFQLFIIDDIHLLHNDRNSVLEWLCSKIRILTKLNTDSPPRLVALGSPMACADSLKSWLSFQRGTKEPVVYNFPPSIRPVKLELTIQKFHQYDYEMRLLTMQRPVYRYVTQHSRDKPVLIFVSDHSQAQDLCEALINYSKSEGYRLGRTSSVHGFSRNKLENFCDSDLKYFLQQDIGYIYNGMNNNDKRLVEDLYNSGQILVLVVTVSMCWSIQCRSYLTIIMDTQQHDGKESTDYELTDIMQMVGLTGRPLADLESRCIIMCQSAKSDYYERFLREPLPVESNLPANLTGHVNYEIAAGALTELNNIYKPYLAHTYFYKRISINPNYYGLIVPEDADQRKVFGTFFNDLVNKVSLDLEKNEFIRMEGSHENPNFSADLLSTISLQYYINYETLSNYTKCLAASSKPYQSGREELIELISTSTLEYQNTVPVRHGERRALKSLQHRYRQSGEIHDYSFKIKLLILSQYQRSRDGEVDRVEGELIADRNYVLIMSHRLLMAIVDIAWLKDSFPLAKNAIQLAKKLVPFCRQTAPNLDVEANIVKEESQVKIIVTVTRKDDPFSMDEFKNNYRLPGNMYRDEGWCFLVHGVPRSKSSEGEKFSLFERVETPLKGTKEYKLDFELSENADAYTYDLYFMSDFYSTREDRKIPKINVHST